MADRKSYTIDYDFAKEQKEKQIKRLKFVTFGFPVIILCILGWSFLLSSGFFNKKVETINQVFPEAKKQDDELEQSKRLRASYKSASIPFEDPKGRFKIIFVTPYVSGEVAVVIKDKNDYDNIKKEADSHLAEAKKTVEITSVTYINAFE